MIEAQRTIVCRRCAGYAAHKLGTLKQMQRATRTRKTGTIIYRVATLNGGYEFTEQAGDRRPK